MTEIQSRIEPEEVLRRLPHRHPFLLVDCAEEYQEGRSIRGIKCVTAGEPCFQGHFPGNPVMPGVLIIESLAQTGALLMSKTLDADIDRTVIYFLGVEKARFRRPVKPGDRMEMPVEILGTRHGVFKFKGVAMVDGVKCAEAEFSATSAAREG
ncbi:3-hydroxyacyl-[acyl-carrier-protein] dehydratase FabZ [Marinicauda salina]|uniref:3-hydroxyacyl-[acyl-carrier-protein] dehydratase FabZ n=1 Tax=Marinicauda salina TaxID=2135793 RepID=A0A2U2BTB6_9PROT|nr:3-hydroxyacyl-ACP dehydratase FabZ [Marinicauda salina]PWE17238.1 3-hydroxyacyl-[acyl-carrier-protein] dehydratase FabZ [Marinicauda salina]